MPLTPKQQEDILKESKGSGRYITKMVNYHYDKLRAISKQPIPDYGKANGTHS